MSYKVEYQNPWFKVLSHTLGDRKYHHISQKNGVVVLAIKNDLEIAFVKIKRHPFEWKQFLELPRGGIDEGETLENATEREALEEVGCTLKEIKLLGIVHPDSGVLDGVVHVFSGKIDAIKTFKDVDEIDECVFYSYSEIVKKINDGEILDGISMSALFLFFTKNNIKI